MRWLRRTVKRFEAEANGRGPRYIGTLLDITESVRAEEHLRHINLGLEQRVAERTAQLSQANQELEAFSYTVSHDLKAPLRGIDGYSQLLVEEYGDRLDEDGRQFVWRIRHGVQLMGELINDLLEYSRMERRDMAAEPVSLLPLVQHGDALHVGLVLGPLIHEFGWQAEDWDLLAAGTLDVATSYRTQEDMSAGYDFDMTHTPALAGRIGFGSPTDLGSRVLPGVLSMFARSHPAVQVDVAVGRSADLIEKLDAGELDLILINAGNDGQDDAEVHAPPPSLGAENSDRSSCMPDSASVS